MTQIILHIGLHRTGTTYIQKTVLPSILSAGVVTPRQDRHGITPYLMGLKNEINLDRAKRSAIRVISREGLSGGPCFTNRFDHLDVVRAFCGEPLVVISYRDPVDLAKSLYLHCYTHNLHNRGPKHPTETAGVVDDGTLTYAAYYAKLETTGKLDLNTLIEKWRGVGEVRVIALDLQKDDPLYYFNCFRNFLGEESAEALPPASQHYRNATTDVEAELALLNTRRAAVGEKPYTIAQFNEDVESVSAKIRESDVYAFFRAYDFYRPSRNAPLSMH